MMALLVVAGHDPLLHCLSQPMAADSRGFKIAGWLDSRAAHRRERRSGTEAAANFPLLPGDGRDPGCECAPGGRNPLRIQALGIHQIKLIFSENGGGDGNEPAVGTVIG